jgi:hypothetical protein
MSTVSSMYGEYGELNVLTVLTKIWYAKPYNPRPDPLP